MHQAILLALRKRRWRLTLFTCAFLAAACAHHHDAAAGDSDDQSRAHHAHRRGSQNNMPANPELGGF